MTDCFEIYANGQMIEDRELGDLCKQVDEKGQIELRSIEADERRTMECFESYTSRQMIDDEVL